VSADSRPAAIRLICDFVNTNDAEGEQDELRDPIDLSRWLVERSLAAPDEAFTKADLNRARDAREALRALLIANNGGSLDADAISSLNLTARSARVLVRFDDDGAAHLEPDSPGIDGALGKILGAVHASMADGTWPRLKACAKHSCRWAFYDTSKNRSRTWCSMKVCGNRVKATRYRSKTATER
jgi:predicted RNA-binding Zn ribbon-like protein